VLNGPGGPPQDAGLGIPKAKTVPADHLDQRGQSVIIKRALPALALVEVLIRPQ